MYLRTFFFDKSYSVNQSANGQYHGLLEYKIILLFG